MTTADRMIAINDATLEVHSANLDDTRVRVLALIETLPIDGTKIAKATTVAEFRNAVRTAIRNAV